MKKLFGLFCIVFILLSTLEAQEQKYGQVGYLKDGMDDIKYKDARIAFSMWTEDLAKKNNILVNIAYYDHSEQILNDFSNSKLDYIALNPIFYLRSQEKIDSSVKEYWIVEQGDKEFESYIVLVRNDSKIKSLKDLKGKVVSTRNDNYVGKMFLDAEMLKELHVESKKVIKGYLNTPKFSTAVLKTFFKKADACIVPEYTFNFLCEMNPALKKEMRIVKQSEEIFYPLIAIFHQNTDKKLLEGFKKNLNGLKDTVRGKNIFDLFKMKTMRRASTEEMLPLNEYYKNYLKLKRDYVK